MKSLQADETPAVWENWPSPSLGRQGINSLATPSLCGLPPSLSLPVTVGMPATDAREYAEDWIARVQGSLILQSASGDRKPFERALSALAQLAEGRKDQDAT